MEQTVTPLVHFYDIETHTISCGARGQTGSTKHKRGVTCPACLAILHAAAAAEDAAAPS